MVRKACRNCNFITEEENCPLCGNPTSKEWQGYLIILDPSRSVIAKKMAIDIPGTFALKVR